MPDLHYHYRHARVGSVQDETWVSLLGMGALGRKVINHCLIDELCGMDYHWLETCDEDEAKHTHALWSAPFADTDPSLPDDNYVVSPDDSLENDSSFFALSSLLHDMNPSVTSEIPDGLFFRQPADRVIEQVLYQTNHRKLAILVLDADDRPSLELSRQLLTRLAQQNTVTVLAMARPLQGVSLDNVLLKDIISLSDSVVDLWSVFSWDYFDDEVYVAAEDESLINEYYLAITLITQSVSGDVLFKLDSDEITALLQQHRYLRLYTHTLWGESGPRLSVNSDIGYCFCDLSYDDILRFKPFLYYCDVDAHAYYLNDVVKATQYDQRGEDDFAYMVVDNKPVTVPRDSTIFILTGSNEMAVFDMMTHDREKDLKRALMLNVSL